MYRSHVTKLNLGLLFAATLVGCSSETAPRVLTTEERLLVEFEAAYSESGPVPEGEVHFELRASPTEVPQFDDAPFAVWAYNEQVPGPVLRVRLGETVVVVLQNDLPQPTTIHWHGVRVPNAMDGVPGVTQPAVEPGESFTYRFTPKDAGTFWFHPHVRGSEQVERGLYGVLIVDDPEPLPWSRDELWVLDDWLIRKGPELVEEFNTRRDLSHDGRWGNVVTVNGNYRNELEARPGERLRLRLANTANGRIFAPDFGELDAKVIAVDGLYTSEPLPAEGFEISPGNRLDLDITIPKGSAGQAFEVVDRFTRQAFILSRIRVSGDEVETPTFEAPRNPNIPEWNEFEAVELDAEYVLNARAGGKYGLEWTINDVAWEQAVIDEEFGKLEAGQFHRLRFTNASARLHPMHLHGQFFKVLSRNGEAVSEPYFRDTVLLKRRETVDIGLVPLDWGRWMLHCHILEHAEAGMMTAVDVPKATSE